MIAVITTPLFVVNAFRLLAGDWFVRTEIQRNGFPPDRYGMTTGERLGLAVTGLRSILPGSEGTALLERATLPDGSPAFNGRELRHMADVRSRLLGAFRAQLAVIALLFALAVAFARSTRWRTVVPRGLMIGSIATLAVAAAAFPVILLGFDGFLLRFHQAFFSGESWRFADTDTLLRIYPEAFWRDTAVLVAVIVVAQAVVVALVARSWSRRVGSVARGAS